MCTLSIVRGAESADQPLLTLIMNRDELRGRASSLPPEIRLINGVRLLMPVDAESRGTWIAVNQHAVIFALLNANPEHTVPPAPARRSRGLIIPDLASCTSLSAAVAMARTLDARAFSPFSLVMFDRSHTACLRSDGASLVAEPTHGTPLPAVWSSSGLGDHRVISPRARLFEQTVGAACGPSQARAAQAEFHRHSWPHAPELSVAMSRADARTVSRTRIELFPHQATMSVEVLNDQPQLDGAAVNITLTISSPRTEPAL